MSASNFIILFNAKEGTSPLVRLLNNFEQLSVVHQINEMGWEPFDTHNCGRMPLKSFEQCFDLIYGCKPVEMARLNEIYTQTATRPLEEIGSSQTIAFKMRFHPANRGLPLMNKLPIIRKTINPMIVRRQQQAFKKVMFGVLKKYQIVIFIAVRQDVFRWALSKYHGDGMGKPGNLQFKLADGSLKESDLKKIHVSCGQLEKIILNCEQMLKKKTEFNERA